MYVKGNEIKLYKNSTTVTFSTKSRKRLHENSVNRNFFTINLTRRIRIRITFRNVPATNKLIQKIYIKL